MFSFYIAAVILLIITIYLLWPNRKRINFGIPDCPNIPPLPPMKLPKEEDEFKGFIYCPYIPIFKKKIISGKNLESDNKIMIQCPYCVHEFENKRAEEYRQITLRQILQIEELKVKIKRLFMNLRYYGDHKSSCNMFGVYKWSLKSTDKCDCGYWQSLEGH